MALHLKLPKQTAVASLPRRMSLAMVLAFRLHDPGGVRGIAAQISGRPVQDAAGGNVEGAAVQVAGAVLQSAAGTVGISGVAVQTSSPPDQTVQVASPLLGTAAQVSGAPSQVAAGTTSVSGSSAQAAGKPLQSAVAAPWVTGASAQISGTPQQSGNAVTSVSGAAIQSAGATAQSGSGTVSVPGTAAQTANLAQQTATGSVGIVYDTDADAYFTAMTVQPDTARKGLINDLILGLKTDGVWSLMSNLTLFAAHDVQAAKVNARYPAILASAINSPTFAADRGFTGDGTSSYLDMNDPVQARGQYTATSSAMWVYVNQQITTGRKTLMGVAAGNNTWLKARSDSGDTDNYMNASTRTYADTTLSRLGLRLLTQNGSTLYTYRNTTLLDSGATVTLTLPGSLPNMLVLSAAPGRGPDRVAAAGWGSHLSATQVGYLNSRLSTFLTAIGAN